MNHAAQLTIGLIGPGRAGAPIAAALSAAGHSVSHVSAVSDYSVARAKSFIPTAKIVDPLELVKSVDLVVVAVPDDEIDGLVAGLSKSGIRKNQLWMHLSGAHGLLPLLPVIDGGAIGLAVHPAMTFTGDISDIERLQECPFAVTASEDFLPIAIALVLEMGGNPVVIADADRGRYHAALSHAANHLNTLISESADLLRAIGVADTSQFLLPLTSNALEHSLQAGTAALTGPIRRGDVQTIKMHLAEIADKQIRATYIALAKATLNRVQTNLPKHVVDEMQKVLDSCE